MFTRQATWKHNARLHHNMYHDWQWYNMPDNMMVLFLPHRWSGGSWVMLLAPSRPSDSSSQETSSKDTRSCQTPDEAIDGPSAQTIPSLDRELCSQLSSLIGWWTKLMDVHLSTVSMAQLWCHLMIKWQHTVLEGLPCIQPESQSELPEEKGGHVFKHLMTSLLWFNISWTLLDVTHWWCCWNWKSSQDRCIPHQ